MTCSPRTRGWSPASAGCSPSSTRAPRARGGGPSRQKLPIPPQMCSPRTRGWSHRHGGLGALTHVLPAHAGVVPRPCPSPPSESSAPRARGGGPSPHGYRDASPTCSPRTRGWSLALYPLRGVDDVLPVRAGRPPVSGEMLMVLAEELMGASVAVFTVPLRRRGVSVKGSLLVRRVCSALRLSDELAEPPKGSREDDEALCCSPLKRVSAGPTEAAYGHC